MRSLLRIALLVAILVARPAHGQGGFISPGDLPVGPIGTIVAPHGAGVVLTNVATGMEEAVAVMPPVGVAGHAAWSPDRTQLAISRFGRRPAERVGGSDILIVPAIGGEALPVVEHDLDGALLGAPAWLPDSSGLYYDHLPPSGSPASSQIMFAALGASAAARAVAVGGWPAVSPDGRLLVYVRPSNQTGYLNELVLTDIGGVLRACAGAGRRAGPDHVATVLAGRQRDRLRRQRLVRRGAAAGPAHGPVRQGRDGARTAGRRLGDERLRRTVAPPDLRSRRTSRRSPGRQTATGWRCWVAAGCTCCPGTSPSPPARLDGAGSAASTGARRGFGFRISGFGVRCRQFPEPRRAGIAMAVCALLCDAIITSSGRCCR